MRNTTCAPRFSLALPIRFRVAGQDLWQTAKTRNLSSSGVLFRSPHLLAPGTTVELEIELNEGFPVPSVAPENHVRARGEVVRELKDESGAQDGWFVAVHYREYRLERGPQPKFPAPLPARTPFTPASSHR